MIGLKEIKPKKEIPQITISKDKIKIYLQSSARKLINTTHVRLFVDTIEDTVIIALQPSKSGYRIARNGVIIVGNELKKLKLKKKQRNNDYLLLEIPKIGRLHAFVFGEVPEEYKKYAVNIEDEEEEEVFSEEKERTEESEVEKGNESDRSEVVTTHEIQL